MIPSQPKDRASSSCLQNLGAIDRHGIHEVGGPFLVGGACSLGARTGFSYHRDLELLHILTDQHRFHAYLEFREQAIEIAAAELVSGTNSPADLFRWVATDKRYFNCYLVEYFFMRYMRHDGASSILQPCSAGTEVDNVMHYMPKDDISKMKYNKNMLREQLSNIQRYFAYRKHLVKLDFIQSNSDPEDVLLRLKSSNRCPTLQDDELRQCLKSHINFLKEYEKIKRDPGFSIPEYENAASQKINAELSSGLQKHLDHHDWGLMALYYERMKLRGLSRACATQAQKTGVILVGEALPLREHLKQYQSENPGPKNLSSIEQAVKQSLQDYMGRVQEKFRSRASLGNKSSQFILLSTIGLGTLGLCVWRRPTK